MNDTINLTLATNPSMILAVAGVVFFLVISVALSGLGHSVRSVKSSVNELSDTIKRKDFKLKPEFDKNTGELVWEQPQYQFRPLFW